MAPRFHGESADARATNVKTNNMGRVLLNIVELMGNPIKTRIVGICQIFIHED
jgi:hypothetical protein